jgi:hypothetical protein
MSMDDALGARRKWRLGCRPRCGGSSSTKADGWDNILGQGCLERRWETCMIRLILLGRRGRYESTKELSLSQGAFELRDLETQANSRCSQISA